MDFIKRHAKKSLTILAGIIFCGFYMVVAYYYGVYLLASPKCPFGTMEITPRCYSGKILGPRCELLYSSYHKLFVVCNDDGEIIEGICPTGHSAYCWYELVGVDYVATTFAGMVVMFLNIAAWITTIGMMLTIPGKYLYKSDNKHRLITIAVQVLVVLCTIITWYNLMIYFFHDWKEISCKLYEKCAGKPKYCKDMNKYCYIDNPMFLQFQMLLISILAIVLVVGTFSLSAYYFYKFKKVEISLCSYTK